MVVLQICFSISLRLYFQVQKFQLPLSRQEISEMVGISRESTGSVLSKFNSEGLVKIAGKKVEYS